MAQQRNAGSRERPQRWWATRTTGVSDISSPVKNFTAVKFILYGGGLLVSLIKVPHLLKCILY